MTDSTTLYTLAQVAENNGKNGKPVWFIIKDCVYNVTEYLDEHPGGADLLKDEAGKDVTKVFFDNHSNEAKNILKRFKIGELVEEDRNQNTKSKKGPNIKTVADTPKENKKSCLSIITCGCLM